MGEIMIRFCSSNCRNEIGENNTDLVNGVMIPLLSRWQYQRTICTILILHNENLIYRTNPNCSTFMTELYNPDQDSMKEYLAFANRIADGARDIALTYFRQPKEEWTKSDNTFVTEVDLKIEMLAREMVENQFPDHAFFGEEFGHSGSCDFKWCIDPIDGTEQFVLGLPLFGVLIALTYRSKPIVGVIEMPALGERWSAANGIPTTWQHQPCVAKRQQKLKDSVVFATSIDMFSEKEKIVFDCICAKAKKRRFGADCYVYGLLASGYVDVIMEADMKPYDIMALVPVVENANGVITDWSGNDITLGSGFEVLATSNSKLHEECLKLIECCRIQEC